MNIMLATVTERTREIGIRRALGARRADITRQFLVETIVLSILGGMFGIVFGLGCPWAIRVTRDVVKRFFPQAYENLPAVVTQMEPTIVWASIPLAFGIAVIVGVVFGIYPAMRGGSNGSDRSFAARVGRRRFVRECSFVNGGHRSVNIQDLEVPYSPSHRGIPHDVFSRDVFHSGVPINGSAGTDKGVPTIFPGDIHVGPDSSRSK